MPTDAEFHPNTTVGRLSTLRARLRRDLQVQLGVPLMRTVTFDLDGEIYKGVYRVSQVGAQTQKAYKDTSVELRLEDLIIHDVPRSIPSENVHYSLVILGKPPNTERAEVIWVDERNLTHFEVIIRTAQQR